MMDQELPSDDQEDKTDAIHRRISTTRSESLNSADHQVSTLSDTSGGREETRNNDKETRSHQDDDDVGETVPDGGWGWIVVFGASLIVVLVDTMGQCFGILFSTFLLDLKTSAVVIAWIFNLYQFIYNMTGPILGPLITHFGWRNLAMICSFVLTIGTITSAFVKSAYVLFLTYSLFVGVGCGVLSNISYLIVPHYFKKRRGLANGMIMAWDCGGQFIGAPLIKILQDEYSFTGATLILGGIILNCCVGAAVFHPVTWHIKPKNQNVKPIEKREEEHLLEYSMETTIPEEGSNSQKNLACDKRQENVLTLLLKSIVNDLKILKSAKAIIIAITTTTTFNGYLNFLGFVPFAMQETGHSLGDAATCVSISAICNIVTRIVIAAFSDTKFFNFRITLMASSLIVSCTMLSFTLVSSLSWVKVIMAAWGCGVGSYNGIFNLVMIHYMGIEDFIPMFGASLFVTGFGYLAVGPLAGYIRDATGNYVKCIWFLAGISMTSFVFWLLMPLAEKFDLNRACKKKDRKENKVDGVDALPAI